MNPILPQSLETMSYIGGAAFSAATLLGSLSGDPVSGGWLPVIVQAGMAGVVVLLLLKHIPCILEAHAKNQHSFMETLERERIAFRDVLAAERESHERNIERIVNSQSVKDAAWQEIVNHRGQCPIRDTEGPN